MKIEVWKDIIGYEGYYKISNLSRVSSVDRVVPSLRWGEQSLKGIIKKYSHNGQGYKIVHLSKHGKVKTTSVHRLVAIHFIENKYLKPQVNHIDGDKLNNSIENLEWVTALENNVHAHDTGLKNSNVYLVDRELFKKEYLIGVSLTSLRKKYRISNHGIYSLLRELNIEPNRMTDSNHRKKDEKGRYI